MKKFLPILLGLLLVPAISGCESHTHEYSCEVLSEADCINSGLNKFTCTCGDTYDETVSATNEHLWGEQTVVREATCKEDGEANSHCKACDAVKTAVLEKTEAHDWSDGEITLAATCASDGVLTSSCSVCGKTEDVAIPKTDEHVWGSETVTKAPSCVQKGESTAVCEVCGKTQTKELEITDAHTWDNGTVSKESTCAAEGIQAFTCTDCGAAKTESIPKTGDHTWDNGRVTKNPTCAAGGTLTFTCGICSATKTESIKKTEDHIWDNGWISPKPTCASEGVKTYWCTVCRGTKKEAVPPTGEHTWKKLVTLEPTYTSEGVLTYDCTKCDSAYTEPIGKYNFRPELLKNPHYMKTTNNPDNYIEFEISGSELTISGKIVFDDLEKLRFSCGDSNRESDTCKYIEAESGEKFSVTLSLSQIREATYVKIHTYQRNGDGMYWSYIWNDIAVEPTDGGYRFVKSLVLDHNIEVLKHWVDPRDHTNDNIPTELKELSDSIVGSATDDYQKMYLLNKWVAENIYYDYDYYEDRSSEVYYSPLEVYQHKRSVCSGYARLLKTLIQAQGIPCMSVSTYSAGASTKGYFDSTNYATESTNHAHVEAYLASEDRWVTMDPTWDSDNDYRNGKFITGEFKCKYFDMSPDFFSYSHKIIRRGE